MVMTDDAVHGRDGYNADDVNDDYGGGDDTDDDDDDSDAGNGDGVR